MSSFGTNQTLGKDAKIAIIGAGAIGGITTGFIARAGYDVEVACKHQELADKIKSGKLHIFGVKGNFRVSAPAVAKISELSGPKDIVFLATKATDMLDAAKELLPFLHPSSIVVSMQNGMCEDALAEILDRQRTIGCVIRWGATMHSLGELEMTATGGFVIGNIDDKPDRRLPWIKELLGRIAPVEITENIKGAIYSKLIVNVCITSVGAICGLHLGRMLSIRKVRSIFIKIAREAMEVAKAMGVKVERFAGKIDYYRFVEETGPFDNFKHHLVMRLIGFRHPRLKSSSLQSLERGRPTEIDYLNGYIASNGRRYNVPTPVNDRIIEIVKDIEAGRREITPDNLNDPFFAKF